MDKPAISGVPTAVYLAKGKVLIYMFDEIFCISMDIDFVSRVELAKKMSTNITNAGR